MTSSRRLKPRETSLLDWLDNISFQLRFHRTLKEALSQTAPLICGAFQASSMAVWFLEPNKKRLRLEFSYRLDKKIVRFFQDPKNYPLKGEGIVGKAFLKQKVVIARNFPAQQNIPKKWRPLVNKSIQTLLSQPLFAENGQLVGILNLYFASDKEFIDQELLTIKIISNSVGAVVEAQDTYAYLQENRNTLQFERDQLAKLYQAVQTIGIQEEATLQEVVASLMKTVGSAIGAKGVAVWKATEDKTYLQVFAHGGISDHYARYFDSNPYPIDKKQTAILVRAFLENDLKFTNDLWSKQEIIKTIPPDVKRMLQLEHIFSVASAPLRVEEDMFGVLNFYFSEPHSFASSEQYVLRLAGNITAFVIGNIQYRQKLTAQQTQLEKAFQASEDARHTVEEEQNKTRAIIEKFSDGLIVVNNKHIVEIVNPEAEFLLNIPAVALLGKRVADLKMVQNFKTIAPILPKKNEDIFRKEVLLPKQKTGEITTISLKPKQNNLGFFLVIHDITQEKRIERVKTEFVSLAAHQLRTPTSEVKWALQAFLEGDMGELQKEQEELLHKTYQANEQMITLINDLLDTSRIEGGKLLYKYSLVNVEGLVQEELKSYGVRAEKKKITCLFEKPKAPINVLLDKEKIRMVIQNLLENAILYTPPGGTVKISITSSKKEIIVAIKDTGIGIPAQEADKIFQKFSRASNAKELAVNGSGLGLFVSKSIVETHNGKLWFKPNKTKGTTFFMALPR
jgi:signal transduction histidine kinase